MSFGFSAVDADPAFEAARTLRCAGCRRANAKLVGGLRGGFKKLERYAGTRAAKVGMRLTKALAAGASR